jgi:hypothetical protein
MASKEYFKKYREINKEKLAKQNKEWRDKNKEVLLKRSTEYRKLHKNSIKEYMKEYRKNNEQKLKNYDKTTRKEGNLRRTYGISIEEYGILLKKQGGRCAICGKIPNGRDLCVDHDHKTGKIRGLLCHNCNTGIGQFQDNILLLQNTIKYLERERKVEL